MRVGFSRAGALLVASAMALGLGGCYGGKSSTASEGAGVAKGVAGQYYYVNIAVKPAGGRISSADGRIDCGAGSRDACGTPATNGVFQTQYAWGEMVTLTATPAPGQVFISWAGDCAGIGECTLSAGADRSVVPVFGSPGSGHPTFMDPAVHGPAYVAQAYGGQPLVCTRCHGAELKGMSIAPSCSACHAWPLSGVQAVAALERSGVLPILDRGTSLAGPDGNTNGIRDDVELYIASRYAAGRLRSAAIQYASVVQSEILVEKSDRAAMDAIVARSARAINCIYSTTGVSPGTPSPSKVVRELTAVTLSTKARLREYLAFSRSLDGTRHGLPEGDTCEP